VGLLRLFRKFLAAPRERERSDERSELPVFHAASREPASWRAHGPAQADRVLQRGRLLGVVRPERGCERAEESVWQAGIGADHGGAETGAEPPARAVSGRVAQINQKSLLRR